MPRAIWCHEWRTLREVPALLSLRRCASWRAPPARVPAPCANVFIGAVAHPVQLLGESDILPSASSELEPAKQAALAGFLEAAAHRCLGLA